jgi:hypothetical protein
MQLNTIALLISDSLISIFEFTEGSNSRIHFGAFH